MSLSGAVKRFERRSDDNQKTKSVGTQEDGIGVAESVIKRTPAHKVVLGVGEVKANAIAGPITNRRGINRACVVEGTMEANHNNESNKLPVRK